MSIQYLYKEDEANKRLLQYSWFTAMHTRIDILLYHSSKDLLESTICDIYDEIVCNEKIAGFYDPQSELYVVNQQASRQPFQLSNELYHMIELCLEYNRRTFGCFDVTIKSRFFDNHTIDYVLLEKDTHSVFYGRPDIKVDLSGFVKGYTLEKIRKILEQAGLNDALISLGTSSIMALGNHPSGIGWKIDFSTKGDESAPTVQLCNQCLSTSGNNSEDREHIISPSTGNYIEGIRYAAVVTKNAIDGEVLSTSLCVASQQQKKDITKDFDIDQIIIF